MKTFRKMLFWLIIFCSFIFFVYASEEDERFYIAEKAFSDGFYEASISLFERFIDEFPQSKKICKAELYIAKCYYFKKEYLKALHILNDIVNEEKCSEDIDEVYYWIGEVHFKGKNFKETLLYTDKIIKIQPHSEFYWWAHYLAAKAYFALSKEKEAVGFLKKIITNVKEIKLINNAYDKLLDFYLDKKEYLQIISLGEDYLKKYPQGELKAKIYFYLGKSYYAHQKFNQAITSYKLALQLTNDTYRKDMILQELGFSFLASGLYEEGKRVIEKIKDNQLRLFSQGVYFFKLKDYLTALEKFDIFLKRFPQSKLSANVYLNKAEILYEMGRINDAIYLYQYLLENFKTSKHKSILDKAHYGLAWCYLRSGKFKKAIEEFKNTLKYTDNPIVKISSQIQIADAYQEAKKFSEALEIYGKILKNYPNTIYADYIQFQIAMVFMKMKKMDEAYLALKTLERNFPTSKLLPEAKYYLAVSYFSLREYKEAEKLLEDLIKKYSQTELISKVYYLYGKCFFNEKKYEKALEVFETIKGKSKDKEIEELLYIDIGHTYLNLSLLEKAKKIWEEFLNKFPYSQYAGSVALYLGGIYEKEGEYRLAEKYYDKVIKNWPNSVWVKDAIFSLGHLHLSKGNLDKAYNYFEQLLSEDSPIALKAKLYIAKIYHLQQQDLKALKIYDELIKSNFSISKAALLEKAYLLKDAKRYLEAVNLFKKAIKLGLDSPKLRFYLGYSLEKINKNKEAIDEYFKVIYLFNENDYKIKSYFRIAKIYEKDKNYEGAKEIYKKLIKMKVKESNIAQGRLKALENK
jgi:tetratricopeptide (TPR) repeat protein